MAPTRSRSSSGLSLSSHVLASAVVLKCLAMTSVMWYSAAAARPSPPPLFQSPLVTAEQVSKTAERKKEEAERRGERKGISMHAPRDTTTGPRHHVLHQILPNPSPFPSLSPKVRASLAAGSTSGNPKDRSIKFLDSSWHLDKTRDAKKEFLGTFMRDVTSVIPIEKCAATCTHYFLTLSPSLPPSLPPSFLPRNPFPPFPALSKLSRTHLSFSPPSYHP